MTLRLRVFAIPTRKARHSDLRALHAIHVTTGAFSSSSFVGLSHYDALCQMEGSRSLTFLRLEWSNALVAPAANVPSDRHIPRAIRRETR